MGRQKMAFYDDEGAFRGSKEEAKKRPTLDLNKVNGGEKRAVKKPRFDVLVISRFEHVETAVARTGEVDYAAERVIVDHAKFESVSVPEPAGCDARPGNVRPRFRRCFGRAAPEWRCPAAQAQSVPPSSDNHNNEYA